MERIAIFDVIERMAALIRSEERKKCTELGLQPVHFQVLDYLSRCNRFSDTPAALTNYLGMTRGTVSQTLQLLEKKGYVQKTTDRNDRRVVHLNLLKEGEDMLSDARSTELFREASTFLATESNSTEQVFSQTLLALQRAHKSQTFGLCKSCKFFTRQEDGDFLCGLTKEALSTSDSEKICQEHTVN